MLSDEEERFGTIPQRLGNEDSAVLVRTSNLLGVMERDSASYEIPPSTHERCPDASLHIWLGPYPDRIYSGA